MFLLSVYKKDRKVGTDSDYEGDKTPRKPYTGAMKDVLIAGGDLSITNDKRILHGYTRGRPYFDATDATGNAIPLQGSGFVIINFGVQKVAVECWYVDIPCETTLSDNLLAELGVDRLSSSGFLQLHYKGSIMDLYRHKENRLGYMKKENLILPN